jgi:hypothetical protein
VFNYNYSNRLVGVRGDQINAILNLEWGWNEVSQAAEEEGVAFFLFFAQYQKE